MRTFVREYACVHMHALCVYVCVVYACMCAFALVCVRLREYAFVCAQVRAFACLCVRSQVCVGTRAVHVNACESPCMCGRLSPCVCTFFRGYATMPGYRRLGKNLKNGNDSQTNKD